MNPKVKICLTNKEVIVCDGFICRDGKGFLPIVNGKYLEETPLSEVFYVIVTIDEEEN